jgi:acetyl-CoA C-acetyltransferase
VTALSLATQALGAIKAATSSIRCGRRCRVGCVDPVGRRAATFARAAALTPAYGNTVAACRSTALRLGLDAINFALAQVMSGQHDMTIGGGVESMSRVGMGASGGAWPMDPADRGPDLLPAAGHLGRPDRDQIRLLARRRRRLRGREPEALQGLVGRRQLQASSVRAVKDINGITILDKDEHMRPTTTMQVARPAAARRSCRWARCTASTRSRCRRIPDVEYVQHVHHAGNSSGHRRRRRRGADRQQGGRHEDRQEAARAHPGVRQYRLEPAIMLTGPIDVTEKVLRKAGMQLSDIDLFELNERSPRSCCATCRAEHPHDKINVAGGAIAMGHPLGATGAMIFGTVLDELERRNLNTALVTLCIGAGMGRRRSSSGCERSHAQDRHQRAADAHRLPELSGPAYKPAAPAGHKTPLGNAVGLSQFGVNLTQLEPGAATSILHWHEQEDEFVYILQGECVLIEDDGESDPEGRRLRGLEGECAERPLHREPLERRRAAARGRHARAERALALSGSDLKFERDGTTIRVLHKDGTPY